MNSKVPSHKCPGTCAECKSERIIPVEQLLVVYGEQQQQRLQRELEQWQHQQQQQEQHEQLYALREENDLD